ncbi:hypothetical protein [Specibacter sp. RAF43]|uniref:hypothetical protein n=1 Tax=Specibacter sp. RAF43 TaxID=3233057 RepID=UPI003F96C42D
MYSTHRASRWTGLAVAALLTAIIAPAPAFARQDTGTLDGTVTIFTGPACELTRIGTQLVRCDSLTGAGVTAPLWVPES